MDRILEQGELTLNILRALMPNQKLSIYAYLFGRFDDSATLTVLPATNTLTHSKTSLRTSWSLNVEKGWKIGPSLEYYRCIKCYFPKTRLVLDIETVTFFPEVISFPKVNTYDFLRRAAEDIISTLTAAPTPKAPSLEAGDTTRNILLKIVTNLKRTDILLVTLSSSFQNDTGSLRVNTQVHHPTSQMTPSLNPIITPTSNI